MAKQGEDVESIVQSFVNDELASLDKVGKESPSLEISSKYTEPLARPAAPAGRNAPPLTVNRTRPAAGAAESPRQEHIARNPAAAVPSPPVGQRQSSISTSKEDERKSSFGGRFMRKISSKK